MKLVAATAIALLIGIGSAAAQTGGAPGGKGTAAPKQVSQAECQQIWSKLDSSKSGMASQAQATPYVTDFKAADANSDGRLSQAEFQNACQTGLVHDSATTGAGSGSSGSAGPMGSGSGTKSPSK
jgi:hypothetical protein